jgi:hypothetical protein
MDKKEGFDKLLNDVINYYNNKTTEGSGKINNIVEVVLKDIENKMAAKCKKQFDNFKAVSTETVEINASHENYFNYEPKDDVGLFYSAMEAYNDCANPFMFEQDTITLMQEQYKKLDYKSWEKCSFECERKFITNEGATLDTARSCLLNCVNLRRFNFRSFDDLMRENIDIVKSNLQNYI